MRNIFFHELSEIFPMMANDEFQALKLDIQQNGLIEPIEVYQGKIIDGRNRYQACRELGIEPKFKEWTGGDPLQFIVSKNLHRRHLSQSQRAMTGARLANMKQGQRTELELSANLPKVSQTQAADMLNIGDRAIRDAKKVMSQGAPELVRAVDSDQVVVSLAAKAAELPRGKQVEFVEKVKSGKKPSEAYREVKKTLFTPKPLPEGKYNVIYADPPWKFEDSTTPDRFAENHYPLMSLDEIEALPVRDIASDNCVLFLWCPNSKNAEAHGVIKAWGFTYKTNFVWIKDGIGLGHYNRQRHELLLVAIAGKPGTPEPENRFDSVINSERREHSRKPEQVYEMIEKMYPNVSKIELFARGSREGWKSWGYEAGGQ